MSSLVSSSFNSQINSNTIRRLFSITLRPKPTEVPRRQRRITSQRESIRCLRGTPLGFHKGNLQRLLTAQIAEIITLQFANFYSFLKENNEQNNRMYHVMLIIQQNFLNESFLYKQNLLKILARQFIYWVSHET